MGRNHVYCTNARTISAIRTAPAATEARDRGAWVAAVSLVAHAMTGSLRAARSLRTCSETRFCGQDESSTGVFRDAPSRTRRGRNGCRSAALFAVPQTKTQVRPGSHRVLRIEHAAVVDAIDPHRVNEQAVGQPLVAQRLGVVGIE